MLTFTEEILLLLGDEEGLFMPIDEHAPAPRSPAWR